MKLEEIKKVKRPWRGLCFLLLISLFFGVGCRTDKYIPTDQSLLTKNKIIFEDDENVEDKTKLEYQLSSFLQKPNENWFFFFPKEGFYYRNDSPGDTSWYKRWILKDIAEPPAILDSKETIHTAEEMKLFLKNLKGFYNADVRSEEIIKGKRAQVNYYVNVGERYHINEVNYIGYDKEVLAQIEQIKPKALLKNGDPIDVTLFEQEKNRIATHLQNIGYANFKSNRLKVYGDSTGLKRKVDVFLEVVPKPDSSNYQKYIIGDISVYTDFIQGQESQKTQVKTIDSIDYHRRSSKFVVKPEQLGKFISISPGKAFNEANRVKTLRNLNSLDVYKFSILKPSINPRSDSLLDFNIFLTPQSSKWISDFGLETFYSTVSNGRQTIGASVFTTLENRNLFGGGENNRLNFEIGGELQFNSNVVGLATSTIRIQDNLQIPTLIDVFKTAGFIHRLGILKGEDYIDLKRDARTNISFGFSSLKIFSLYDILSFNTSIGYSYSRNNRHQFSLRQLALNLNSYNLTNDFLTRINNNPFIINSLENNLLTGFLFRDFNYIYTSPKNLSGNSFQFISNVEVSGWEMALTNGLSNLISGNEDPWRLFGTYDFSKYYKLELDTRFYHDFKDQSSFASRFNIAIARPYSDSEQVPFIKQFYVGGPSGIRAWQIRELGPGSYDKPAEISATSAPFFQQGDFKMQFSFEYRFDIFRYLESALFIDGGNVWTFNESDTRIGSQFSRNFLNDVALGYGWGLRIDLDYFIIRMDFGYKLRRPYTNIQEKRWVPLSGQQIGNINIAINYPF